MSAKLQSLIVSYCGALPNDVEALEHSIALAATSAEAGQSHLAAALARVHRIKGAGGSLGFAAVSAAAEELETQLRMRPPLTLGEDLRIALESLDRLKQLATSVSPEGSTLYGVDLRRLSRTRAGA